MNALAFVAGWYVAAALAVRFTPLVLGVSRFIDGVTDWTIGRTAPVEFDRRAVGFIWLLSPFLVPLVVGWLTLFAVAWAAGAILMPRGRPCVPDSEGEK